MTANTAPAPTTKPPAPEPRPMDAAAIEKELNKLWRAEIEANQKAGATEPPSRTLLHTLVVLAPDHAAAEEARAVAAALSPRLPARTIVMEMNADGADSLNAAASLVCVALPNGQTHVAGEQVSLIASGPSAARRLTGAVLPLLLTNVPSFLWWQRGSPVTHPLLRDLAPVLDRLIVDTFTFGDSPAQAGRSLAALEQAIADPHFLPIVSDLAWARLAPWRYATAQIFDAAGTRPYLDQLRTGEVRYVRGPSGLASLFAAWLAERLGWRLTAFAPDAMRFAGGQVLKFSAVPPAGGVPPGFFAGVTLHAHDADGTDRAAAEGGVHGAEFEVSRHGSTCWVAHQRMGELQTERIVPLKAESVTEWLGHELARLNPVPTYESALKLLTQSTGAPAAEALG